MDPAPIPQTLTFRRPDDWLLHLRDGDMLRSVVRHSADVFGRAIVMPNLQPPVTTAAQARDYRARVLAALPDGSGFTPLMTVYLTDQTSADDLRAGHEEGVVTAVKLYPAGATTHSEHGVTSIDRVTNVLECMQKHGIPLLVHGESTDPMVDVFDREAVFIERTLQKLLAQFPALKVVMEHITTQEAADFVAEDASGRLAATITPQHLLFNRNALFMGGLRPHNYCLPVLKRERHRLALRRLAASGFERVFIGTDSAPHLRALKEAECGCAGVFNAPSAMQAYATVFDEEGALHHLEAFASLNGARFYGLAPSTDTVTLARQPFAVMDKVDLSNGASVKVFLGKSELPWSVVRSTEGEPS